VAPAPWGIGGHVRLHCLNWPGTEGIGRGTETLPMSFVAQKFKPIRQS